MTLNLKSNYLAKIKEWIWELAWVGSGKEAMVEVTVTEDIWETNKHNKASSLSVCQY